MIKIPTPKPGLTFDEALAWLRRGSADDTAKDTADETQPAEPTTHTVKEN